MDFDIDSYMKIRKAWVDEALTNIIRVKDQPRPLFEAMSYSLMAGGKRIRPVLMMASYEIFKDNSQEILPFACAMEMIHTYSLIHDDLPAMDNDDLRRGKPTCHKVYGEAIAILAGDGLLTEAFNLLSDPTLGINWPLPTQLSVIHEIANAAGIKGMVGGQAMDILSEHKDVDVETVKFIHTHKTGAMIRASVRVGALLADSDNNALRLLTQYGESIGMAFQIVDDILDVEGDTSLLGKKAGTDNQLEKATYPHVVGIEESKREAQKLIESAQDSLITFEERAEPLRQVADLILKRNT